MGEPFRCEIKKYRVLAGLTQEDLAVRVGVRRETILRLEAGKYNPSLKLAMDISKVLSTPIESLFFFEE
ncbi:helix-turn-helix transcriptional regulator [uncultured Pseudoflavonifractor sp.]|uniref:helix-turn-helix transcriptional regulator n=1 Tax=uncultured Pseudoflavonifractor sp. TaxID=1221379 RepID=UPI0025FCEB94|nr:helix-turn-helix transcriptional regulator [uncultured Pseudoflavonifractor sp.]